MSGSIQILNDVFHHECRSLAQFMDETDPWTNQETGPARKLMDQIVSQEREWAFVLADLIQERGGTPQPGNYPVEYTDQHFLSLGFMLERLDDTIQSSIAALDRARGQVSDDSAAASIIDRMIEGKRKQIEEITQLHANDGLAEGAGKSS